MNNRTFLLLIGLPVILLGAALGFFGYSHVTGQDTGPANPAEATAYRAGPFRVSVDIEPGVPQVGENRFTVRVADARGRPVAGASISAYGEMPAMGAMAAMRAPADLEEIEPGLYAGPLRLEMRGEWPLSVRIQKDGIGETRLGFDMATGRKGLQISSGGTAVANSMARDTNSGDAMGGSMAAAGQRLDASPEKNDRGFHVVGKYQIKVELLGSGSMVPDAVPHDHHRPDSMHGRGSPQDSSASRLKDRSAPDSPMDTKADMNKSTALRVGHNLLQATVLDLDDRPVNGATLRVAAQLEADSRREDDRNTAAGGNKPGRGNTKVVTLDSAGQGAYRGMLELPLEGDYALAVDVTTEALGHGDLVLAFATGEYGLHAATATPEGIAYYSCSMHSSVRESRPGQCPICSMDLVPVSHEQLQTGVITVDARRRQLIGVKTGQAQLRKVSKTIRAVGQVDYDERRISSISLKFDAWIGELKADFVGAQVEKGQLLFTVYSPELLSAQQEYLESRQRLSRRGPNDSLVRASRQRLMLWDISPAQVRAIERRGEPFEYLPIQAPKSGTLVEKMIVAGSHMKAGDMLLRIADLSTVWIDAEVYEADLPLIDKGMNARITLPYGPDKVYEARVDYIYPYLEGRTRTARIRLVLDNPDGELKPDMYAEVRLHADLGERLMVPEDAVLVAGKSRVVFKDLGEDGKLKPVPVQTGQRVDDWIEITRGLAPGDDIITSGNFLIAAEAKLKTGIEQW